MAAYVRRRTLRGKLLVNFMLDVMQGKPLPLVSTRDGRRSRYPQTPKVEHRLVAAQWLADRGWGKAKELIELQGDGVTTSEQRLALLRRLSDEDQATLRQLLAKALASQPAGDVHQGDVHQGDALDAGAPVELGRPRNVGRAVVPELPEPDPEPDSPADPPADAASPRHADAE